MDGLSMAEDRVSIIDAHYYQYMYLVLLILGFGKVFGVGMANNDKVEQALHSVCAISVAYAHCAGGCGPRDAIRGADAQWADAGDVPAKRHSRHAHARKFSVSSTTVNCHGSSAARDGTRYGGTYFRWAHPCRKSCRLSPQWGTGCCVRCNSILAAAVRTTTCRLLHRQFSA